MTHTCTPCHVERTEDSRLRRDVAARAEHVVGAYRLLAPELEANLSDDDAMVRARIEAMHIAESIVRDIEG